MAPLHPNILEHDGQKAFVVLPYEEFLKLQEILDDYQDLAALRQAKEDEGSAPAVSLNDAKKQLGVS
ncbi:Prevent-host-death family protein [Candidatus Desulfarcum epimagneticum]|uniref:Prevent-host-death family protein n=1 Tax=uncultured Desulfobacteraceae bacterium TaxID=218296 RepID=A0A484HPI2_9BACT|nr:Prevent-host-death family protein [uncultured Desulfobacteraceae bacterium]